MIGYCILNHFTTYYAISNMHRHVHSKRGGGGHDFKGFAPTTFFGHLLQEQKVKKKLGVGVSNEIKQQQVTGVTGGGNSASYAQVLLRGVTNWSNSSWIFQSFKSDVFSSGVTTASWSTGTFNYSENFVVQVGSFEVNNAAAHLYVV
jgi:hypothetical protein